MLACLAEAGGETSSISELVETAATLFTVDLNEVEAARSLGDLVKAGTIQRVDGHFRLSEPENHRLKLVAKESAEISQKALADWREFLTDRWPSVTPVELNQLEDDLQTFLRQVLYRQGAEAAVLLYPDLPSTRSLRRT